MSLIYLYICLLMHISYIWDFMTSGLWHGKLLVQSHFWVIFGTSVLNNSCNGLRYVFEQIISIAAIENQYSAIKI